MKTSKRYSILDCLEIGHKLFTCEVVYLGLPAFTLARFNYMHISRGSSSLDSVDIGLEANYWEVKTS